MLDVIQCGVRCTVDAETGLILTDVVQVMNGAILQQVFVVEFVIQAQMCDDCHRVEAKDFWKAVVQVRQKVWNTLKHKTTS